MSITIHPYLYARLVAVQEAFDHPGFRYSSPANTQKAAALAKKGNNFKELAQERDDDEQGGGGGGTMRGHRGKNAVNAAAAMRKLSRNR